MQITGGAWLGERAALSRYRTAHTMRHFCARCGSLLATRHDAEPGQVFVALGTLEMAADVGIRYQQFADAKADWDTIADGRRSYGAWPVDDIPDDD